jgi:hypothetical protein
MMESKRHRVQPALALFFLAPMIGELLSGSSPPAEFFNPFTLLLLATLYGGGAILARELRVRWGKGWPTVFALGAAYGIVEEGLMVKSFFNPSWMDIGILGRYGRWAGVNWVWSLELTIYHAVISIAIPILLIEVLCTDRRDERWIGKRGMIGLALLLLADVLCGLFLLTPYRPPFIPYLLAIVAVIVLIAIARRLPSRWLAPHPGQVKRPLWFAALGLSATVFFFVIAGVLPNLGIPVLLTLIAMPMLLFGVTRAVRRMSCGGVWTQEHQIALASGALGFFVLFAPLQEMGNANRPDNTTGMALVGLAAFVFLAWLWRRAKHNSATQYGAGTSAMENYSVR